MVDEEEPVPAGRLRRLDALLAARGLDAVWIGRPDTFAWLTRGSNVVDRASDVGVAVARYDGSLEILTDDIEATRLLEEELPAVPVESYPWYTSSLSEAVRERTDGAAAADFPVPGLDSFDGAELRQPLTDGDIESFRDLGEEVAAAVEGVCRDCEPSSTEQEVAGTLRGRLAASGVDTPVTLVGGADRARRYRHYTPTRAKLGDYVLVSVTARRGGLYASCTRTVAFDPPTWLADRHDAASRVEATALAATRQVGREGGTSGDVFDAIQDAYGAVGHAEEWRAHHQGGAAGFDGREWIATPTGEEPVRLPMGYAWNPTVQGAKSEDTALVTEAGVEVLTRTGEWPERTVDAVGSDTTLRRPTILSG